MTQEFTRFRFYLPTKSCGRRVNIILLPRHMHMHFHCISKLQYPKSSFLTEKWHNIWSLMYISGQAMENLVALSLKLQALSLQRCRRLVWVLTQELMWLFFFYCSEFCHTLKWNSHGFTCVPHSNPPSHLPLHPIPVGLPSAPGPSACLMHPNWAVWLLKH